MNPTTIVVHGRAGVGRYACLQAYRRARRRWYDARVTGVTRERATRLLMLAMEQRNRWDALSDILRPSSRSDPSWSALRAQGLDETELRLMAGDR